MLCTLRAASFQPAPESTAGQGAAVRSAVQARVPRARGSSSHVSLAQPSEAGGHRRVRAGKLGAMILQESRATRDRIHRVAVTAVLALAPATQESAPSEKESLVDRADVLVPALLAEHSAVGAAIAAVEEGNIVLERGYGLAELESGRALGAHTRLNVASLSKAVTAWGVMRLAQTGRVELAAPIDRYLVSWHVPEGAYPTAEVTLERVLRHAGGLGVAAVPWFPVGEPAPSCVAVLEGTSGGRGPVRVEKRPGTEWSYSGGGYTALEVLIEDVTETPFERFMQDEVFRPLGMARATYESAASDDDFAEGHDGEGKKLGRMRFVGASAGGLLASAADFARLLVGYTQGWQDGNVVLSRERVRALAAEPIPVQLEGVTGASYGAGHGVHRCGDGRILM